MNLSFVRVRIGVTTVDNESGWHIIWWVGDEPPRISVDSWPTKEEASGYALMMAKANQERLSREGIPWGPG